MDSCSEWGASNPEGKFPRGWDALAPFLYQDYISEGWDQRQYKAKELELVKTRVGGGGGVNGN